MTKETSKRWNRRIGRFVLAVVLAVVVGHAIWGYVEKRSLLNRMQQLHAAGEPIYVEDFVIAPIPDDQNAMADILAALAAFDDTPAWKKFDNLELGLPLTSDERTILQAVTTEGGKAFQLMDRAMTRPACVWAYSPKSPILGRLYPELNHMRALANLLAADALVAHDAGDDARVVRRLSQMVLCARGCAQYPALIPNLVSQGILALAGNRTEMLSTDLKIGLDGAAPEQVMKLIDQFLDDVSMNHSALQALRGERMMGIGFVRAMADGIPITPQPGEEKPSHSNVFTRYAAKPFFYSNARLILDRLSCIAPLVQRTDWPGTRALILPTPEFSVRTFLAYSIVSSLDRAVQTHFRFRTDRHLAATTLAIRWYASEHGGNLPPILDDLVPKYLPAVPLDPMASSAQLKYRPAGPDPIIYSVADNGTDEAGSEKPLRKQDTSHNEWQMQDRVVHLTRQPRLPTTEPAE